ncbi:PAQR family membrane homeostasis protein TrhA [Rhodoplanes serenus]|uniref:PAQR family membrane homeostasis protein TrhA n=1 Tax=Rhodoplanes serenus TaxID=200615 RepID=UPI001FDF59F2|nr:hemolysin III family protein [Rhodoplanes serenus]
MPPCIRPRRSSWDYDRAELVADGVMHVIGSCLAVVGAAALLIAAALDQLAGPLTPATLTYSVSLVAMIGISAAYNMWPPSSIKWFLRRFDHSAIYLLIAGTYTPFLAPLKDDLSAGLLLIAVWLTAGIGIALKLGCPGRFDRLSYVLYLLLGWSGVAIFGTLSTSLPFWTLLLLVIGGVLYSVGVVFHLWRNLRFQNAIWHGFVLGAAVCHYIAVFGYAALAEA